MARFLADLNQPKDEPEEFRDPELELDAKTTTPTEVSLLDESELQKGRAHYQQSRSNYEERVCLAITMFEAIANSFRSLLVETQLNQDLHQDSSEVTGAAAKHFKGQPSFAATLAIAAQEQQRIKQIAHQEVQGIEPDPEELPLMSAILKPQALAAVVESVQVIKAELEEELAASNIQSVVSDSTDSTSFQEENEDGECQECGGSHPECRVCPTLMARKDSQLHPPSAGVQLVEYSTSSRVGVAEPPPPIPQEPTCSVCDEDAEGRCQGGLDSCGAFFCGGCSVNHLQRFPTHTPVSDDPKGDGGSNQPSDSPKHGRNCVVCWSFEGRSNHALSHSRLLSHAVFSGMQESTRDELSTTTTNTARARKR